MQKQVIVIKTRVKQAGFSLIDIMISVGIFGILVLGTSSLMTYMMKTNQDLNSKLSGPELQNLINHSFASSSTNTQCNKQLLTPSGARLTLPLPAPNTNLPNTPIAVANTGGALFVFDGQKQNNNIFSVQLSGIWRRTLTANGSAPQTERFNARIQISMVQQNSKASLQSQPINIPITLDVESATGLVSSCTAHTTADDLSSGVHSSFDCINTGGEAVYAANGKMVCKFSMYFLNGAPSVTCPTYFQQNPLDPTNCIPSPQKFPISGCPDFPDGSKGNFCSINGGVAYPSAAACGTYSTTTPMVRVGRNGSRCPTGSVASNVTVPCISRGRKTTCTSTICKIQKPFPIPTANGAYCTSQSSGAKACATNFIAETTILTAPTSPVTTYQRCHADPNFCKLPFQITWISNIKTWSCTFTPTICPKGLATVTPLPNLSCKPLSNYLCTTPGVPCLSCPNGWTPIATGYSGVTMSGVNKLAESVTCF